MVEHKATEAVLLVVCDPPMNELRATYTGLCIYLFGSRSYSSFIDGSHTTKNTASDHIESRVIPRDFMSYFQILD
jgi:hypothetical protein